MVWGGRRPTATRSKWFNESRDLIPYPVPQDAEAGGSNPLAPTTKPVGK